MMLTVKDVLREGSEGETGEIRLAGKGPSIAGKGQLGERRRGARNKKRK